MLKALPLEPFNIGKEEFDKDFEEILNTRSDEDHNCKYTAISRRAMGTHKQFVHDTNFYICNKCQGRTKTVGAIKIQMWNAHSVSVIHDKVN